ncbi:hypothetical protein V500_06440 [Pseudogymnoascus sp. VKM F-4518 (FW-2643)]|nr:hypothetical protein V500_06440 [Pseudogymnoascus sp. VKM F-4518 (FW-2643)]
MDLHLKSKLLVSLPTAILASQPKPHNNEPTKPHSALRAHTAKPLPTPLPPPMPPPRPRRAPVTSSPAPRHKLLAHAQRQRALNRRAQAAARSRRGAETVLQAAQHLQRHWLRDGHDRDLGDRDVSGPADEADEAGFDAVRCAAAGSADRGGYGAQGGGTEAGGGGGGEYGYGGDGDEYGADVSEDDAVYVVGMYVATDDIAQLQRTLVKKIEPIATTLVAGEKDTLKERLMDPEAGEEVWNHILSSTSVRTLFRIVPVRDTDFGHMRDAYVRAVTAQARKHPEEFGDDKFGQSVAELKAMFGHGNVPKGRELVLARSGKGSLAAWFDAGKAGPQRLGEVDDERISRALWLHYLAGSHVASEAARKSIVDGIMEFVERPVGTVAAQVHV